MRQRAIVIIGIYQVVGGALALFNVIYTLSIRELMQGTLWVLVGPAVVGVLSLVSGVLLLKRTPAGPSLSLIVQALQVVGFSLGNFAYALGLGLVVDITLGGNPPPLMQRTSTYFILDWGRTTYSPFLVINLLALAAITVLAGLRGNQLSTRPSSRKVATPRDQGDTHELPP